MDKETLIRCLDLIEKDIITITDDFTILRDDFRFLKEELEIKD